MEETTQKSELLADGVKIYELSFLVAPFVGEEHLPAKVTAIKDMIAERGGNFISEEFPRYIELSYSMERTITNKKEKFSNAYFGWVKFELEAAKVAELNAVLLRAEEIIRFLLISTVRENTIASKRPLGRDNMRKRAPASDEPKVEINKEEVDAQIEALVAE